jgi:predicted nucleotidyltransferase
LSWSFSDARSPRGNHSLVRELDAFGVAHLSLFGSFARDEGREDSDVDLLVEFSRPVGLFQFVSRIAARAW